MRKFSHVSYHERAMIYRKLCEQKGIREIAREIGRDPSTVSREVRRNADQIGYLYAGEAHEMAEKRRHRNKPKIVNNLGLKTYIVEKIQNERWSPRVIAGRWNLENEGLKISPEAIYQWIYSKDCEKLELRKYLIRARRKRGLRRKATAHPIKGRTSVHDRPEIINQRAQAGHLEGDLIFNSGSQSMNITTMVDRVTRYAILVKNESKHSKTIMDAMTERLLKEGIKVKSMTFDNGTEFAEHGKLKDALGANTYFCDPGAPWQKGSIENLNGMLRRFLPFSMKAHDITSELVEQINQKINNMPRAILGFKTPLEAMKAATYA